MKKKTKKGAAKDVGWQFHQQLENVNLLINYLYWTSIDKLDEKTEVKTEVSAESFF
jgi:hypothetical protein